MEKEGTPKKPSSEGGQVPFGIGSIPRNTLSGLCAALVRGTSIALSPTDALRHLVSSCQELAAAQFVLLLVRFPDTHTTKVFLANDPQYQGLLLDPHSPGAWDRLFASEETICIQGKDATEYPDTPGLLVESHNASKEEINALEAMLDCSIRCALFSPIPLSQGAYDGGLLCVINQAEQTATPARFEPAAFVVTRSIAEACGNNLGRFRSAALFQRASNIQQRLLALIRSFRSDDSISGSLAKLCSNVRKLLGCGKVNFFLLDRSRSTFSLLDLRKGKKVGADVFQYELFHKLRIGTCEAHRGLVGLAAKYGRTIAVVNPSRHKAFDAAIDLMGCEAGDAGREKEEGRPYSMLCCPIRDQDGTVYGVLQLLNKTSGAPDPTELLYNDPAPLASTDRLRSRGLYDATEILASPFDKRKRSMEKKGQSNEESATPSEKGVDKPRIPVTYVEFTKEDAEIIESLAIMTATWLRRARGYVEMKQAKLKVEALLEIFRSISKTGNFYSFLNSVARALRKALSPDKLSIFIRDNVKDDVWCAVSEDIELFRVPLGKGIVGHVAETGEVVNAQEVSQDPHFDPFYDKITGYTTSSVLCVPVRDHTHRVVAVVEAVNKVAKLKSPAASEGESKGNDLTQVYSFSKHDEELLKACCAEIAVALKRFTMEMILYAEDASERMKSKRSKTSTQQKMFMDSFLATYSSVMSYQTLGWSRGSPRHSSLASPHARRDTVAAPHGQAAFGRTLGSPPFLRQRRWSMTHLTPSAGAGKAAASASMSPSNSFRFPPREEKAQPSQSQAEASPPPADDKRRRNSSPCPAPRSAAAVQGMASPTESPRVATPDSPALDTESLEAEGGASGGGDALLQVHHHAYDTVSSDSEDSTAEEEGKEAPGAAVSLPAKVAQHDQENRALTLQVSGFLALRGRGSATGEASDRANKGARSRRWVHHLSQLVSKGSRRSSKYPSPSTAAFHDVIKARGSKGSPNDTLHLLFSKGDGWASPLWRQPDAWLRAKDDRGAPAAPFPSIFGGAVPKSVFDTWDFDVWSVPPAASPALFWGMLQELDVVEEFNLSPNIVYNYVAMMYCGYTKTNPFHNFFHGLHVAQAVYMLMRQSAEEFVLKPLERLALVVAGLGHDVDHPGVTNAFLESALHPLALQYNDCAVLENHHAASTYMALRRPDCAVWGHLPPRLQTEARAVLVHAILATDMSRHMGMVTRLQTLEGPIPQPGEPDKASIRHELRGILLHTADLAGQALSWHLAAKWGQCVCTEFQEQALAEKELKLPLTPFMQGLDSPGGVARLQSGFCEFVLLPLWRGMADLFPKLQNRVVCLEENVKHYGAMLAEVEEEEEE